jgi:hypothetical protein
MVHSTSFTQGLLFRPVVLIDRFIQGGVKTDEWPRYVSEVYRILKPGGYAQMGEIACASPISEHDCLPHDAPMAEVLNPLPIQKNISGYLC